MLAEIGADRGAIRDHRDPQRRELRGGADAGKLEDARRPDRAGAQDDLAPRPPASRRAADLGAHRRRPPLLESDAVDQRAGDDVQVAPVTHRPQERLIGAHPAPAADGQRRIADAVARRRVDVVPHRRAEPGTGGEDRIGQPGAVLLDADVHRPACAARVGRPQLMILDRQEGAADRLPAPAGRARRLPVVIILRMAAGIDHAVDRARSAQRLAAQPDPRRIAGLGLRRIMPGEARIGQRAAQPQRNADIGRGRFRPRLDQRDGAVRIGAQPARQHAAGGAAADDDIIERLVHGASAPGPNHPLARSPGWRAPRLTSAP